MSIRQIHMAVSSEYVINMVIIVPAWHVAMEIIKLCV